MKRGDLDLELMSNFQLNIFTKLIDFIYRYHIDLYIKQNEIVDPIKENEKSYIAFFCNKFELEIDVYYDEIGYVFGNENGVMFERIRGETDKTISDEFFVFIENEFKKRGII